MSEAIPVETLTPEEAAAELARLAALIAEADAAYYQEDAPVLTDAEYDAARQRNLAIEARFPDLKREDSPSDRVGAAAQDGFAKAAHAAPMLSLDNAFSDEDVEEFAGRIRRFLGLGADETLDITAEPKIDGLSLSLTYEKGRLKRAATRGNGQVGEHGRFLAGAMFAAVGHTVVDAGLVQRRQGHAPPGAAVAGQRQRQR